MLHRNRFLLFLLIIFFFSSNFDFSVTPTKSNPARISIESVASTDSDSSTLSTPWIYTNRNYYSHYAPLKKRRQNGTCWKAPPNAQRIAIVAIFLNESQGMHEWLDHYMWQGIDKILLLDNGSTDNWKPIVDQFDRVTVKDAPLRHNQVQYYEESLSWLRENKIDIAIFADLDEYIFSLDGRSLQQVLLEFFFDPVFADVSELFIPWSQFGSSDFIHQPKSVRESFVWRKYEDVGLQYNNGKTFFRVRDVSDAAIHVPRIRNGVLVYAGDRFEGEVFSEMLDPNWVDTTTSGPPLRLNHYMLQSREFFESVKMKRGAADVPEHYDLRTWEYFQENDYHDTKDITLKEYVVEARKNGTVHGFHCKKR
jgi:hypothetical protein